MKRWLSLVSILLVAAVHAHGDTLVFDDWEQARQRGWRFHDSSNGSEGSVGIEEQGVRLRDAAGQPGPGALTQSDMDFAPEGDCYRVDFTFRLLSIGLADDSSGSYSMAYLYFNLAGNGVDLRVYGDRLVFDPAMTQYQMLRFDEGEHTLSFLVDTRRRVMRLRHNGRPIGLYRTYELPETGIRITAMGTPQKAADLLLRRVTVADAEWDNPPNREPVAATPREILPAEWPAFMRDPHNTSRSPLKGAGSHLKVVSSFRVGGATLDDVWSYDTNGDGSRELIMPYRGALRAFDLAGNQVWQAEAGGRMLGFYDLDGDGGDELVLNPLTALDPATGRIKYTTAVEGQAPVGMGPWKIATLDPGRPGMQAVFITGTKGYVYSFTPGERQARLDLSFSITEAVTGFTPSLVVADVDGQPPAEIVLVTWDRAIALSLADGHPRMFHYWNSGRNYAELVAENIDDDPYPELIVQATILREHLAVLDNDGLDFSLRYDRFYEQNYPHNNKDYEVCVDTVRDFDADGRVEILQSLYNDTGDGRWHTLLLDALTGEIRVDLPDRKVEAVVRRSDGAPAWILLTRALSRTEFQGVEAYSPVAGTLILSASGRLLLDPTDHRLPAHLGKGALRRGPISRHLAPAGLEEDRLLMQEEGRIVAVDLPAGDREEPVARAYAGIALADGDQVRLAEDMDQDGTPDFVVASPAESLLHVYSGAGGRDLVTFPLPGVRRLATAARLSPDDEELSVMVVDWDDHLQVWRGLTSTPALAWRKPVSPRYGYYRETSSVLAFDFDRDGRREILAGLPGNQLGLLDRDGNVLRRWALDNPVYEWAVGNFNGNDTWDIAVTTSGSVTDYKTFMFDSGAESDPIWQVDLGPYMAGPTACDANGDGIDDYICRYFYMRHILDGRNGLDLQPIPWRQGYHAVTVVYLEGTHREPALLFHKGAYTQRLEKLDGTLIWEHLVQSSARHGCIGDFDGDGELESACQTSGQIWDLTVLKPMEGDFPPTLLIWDLATGRQEASLELAADFQEGVVAVDLDSDGRDEILGGSSNGQLLVLGIEAGSLAIESSLDLGAGVGRPTVADLDLDGRPEVLAGTDEGRMYVLQCE